MPKKLSYKATLTMSKKDYVGEGETPYIAMDNIPIEWHQVDNKGTITLSKGKNIAEKMFFLRQLKRIFANKLTKKFWAKNLFYLLENN